jgi:hypothetical protein
MKVVNTAELFVYPLNLDDAGSKNKNSSSSSSICYAFRAVHRRLQGTL